MNIENLNIEELILEQQDILSQLKDLPFPPPDLIRKYFELNKIIAELKKINEMKLEEKITQTQNTQKKDFDSSSF
jgi:hypothetical protein